jgi:hypothetical protein
MSYIFIDWVHPSVRDTVVEYLMEHDSSRQQFLRSANAAGALTALSTAGGAYGTLVRPLLKVPGDWNALNEAISKIAYGSDTDEHRRLLQGIIEAARVAAADQDAFAEIRNLAVGLLLALQTNWSRRSEGVSPTLLRLFYELSIRVSELVPSPALTSSWATAVAAAEAAIELEIGFEAIDEVRRWLSMVRVVKQNEPRFLLMREQRNEVEVLLTSIVAWARNWSDGLEELDEDETEPRHEFGDEDIEAPVQPSSAEESQQWYLGELIYAIDDVVDLSARKTARDAGTLIGQLRLQHDIRTTRQSRYEEWETSMDDDESDQRPLARDQGSGDFDIEEFFEDL